MKDKFTKEQIENMLKTSTEQIIDSSSTLVDEFGNSFDVNQAIDVAETHIKKKYPKINFRWSEFEIARAKKIAQKLGLPYQTYLKSLLKQGVDKDEKRLQEM